MPFIPQTETLDQEISGDRLALQRTALASRLGEVASAVRMALDEAALPMEIFFVIPSTGDAIISFGTPGDPSDEDWDRVNYVISGIVENIVGVEGLRGRELLCARGASCASGSAGPSTA